ncbi:MAG: hypothetical protein ABIG44_15815 [Planctomycetota bacterium]
MANDHIPRPDDRFLAWRNNFVTYLIGHLADLGLAAGDPPPTGPSELSFLSVDTRMPYVADYPGEGAGKTAHYMLRWVATTGEKGPWSETACATIGA